jgi:hypothetical protein
MKRVLIAAIAACGTPTTPTQPTNQTHMTDSANQPTPTVTARSASEWLVEVKRTLGPRSATAAVVVTTPPSQTEPAPHLAVASAEAWLALARESAKLGAVTDAIAAARNGIAALGHEYRPRKIKDDTELHIGAADDDISKGAPERGANELISVLDTRVALYFQRYASTVHRNE